MLLEGLITVLGALAFLKGDSREAGRAEGAGTVLPSASHPAEGAVRRCPGSQGSTGCGSHHSSQSWLDSCLGSMCQPGWAEQAGVMAVSFPHGVSSPGSSCCPGSSREPGRAGSPSIKVCKVSLVSSAHAKGCHKPARVGSCMALAVHDILLKRSCW